MKNFRKKWVEIEELQEKVDEKIDNVHKEAVTDVKGTQDELCDVQEQQGNVDEAIAAAEEEGGGQNKIIKKVEGQQGESGKEVEGEAVENGEEAQQKGVEQVEESQEGAVEKVEDEEEEEREEEEREEENQSSVSPVPSSSSSSRSDGCSPTKSHHRRSLVVIHSQDSNLRHVVRKAMTRGDVVVIDHIESAILSLELRDLLEKRAAFNDVGKIVSVFDGELIEAHPLFAVYLRSAVPLHELDRRAELVRGCVIDVSLTTDAMANVLLMDVLTATGSAHFDQLRYVEGEMAAFRARLDDGNVRAYFLCDVCMSESADTVKSCTKAALD